MARKTLDEQLLSTQQEIKVTEELLSNLRQKEKNIKEQIDNRNMKEYYAFIKNNNLYMADLEKLVGKINSKLKSA